MARFRLIYFVPRDGVDPNEITEPKTDAGRRGALARVAYDPKVPAAARAVAREMLNAMGGLTAEQEALALRFFGLQN